MGVAEAEALECGPTVEVTAGLAGRVGADAGLIVRNESIAPATMDSAAQIAIRGTAVPGFISGPKIRRARSRRRRDRCSRR